MRVRGGFRQPLSRLSLLGLALLSACSDGGDADAGDAPCVPQAEVEVQQHGDILVIPADERTLNGEAGDRTIHGEAVARTALAHLSVEVDQLAVWTSGFKADRQGGAIYKPLSLDCSDRLAGMALLGQWGDVGVGGSGAGQVRLMAEEFGHQWLVRARLIDPETGEVSDELLGRDGVHWSHLVETGGSFQDGVNWTETQEGTFMARSREERSRFGPLDLWYMGLMKDAEVPPFFVLRDAFNTETGQPIGPDGTVPHEAVSATRVDLTVADLRAAAPPPEPREREIRQVFVLLARPEDDANDVASDAEALEDFRSAWTAILQEELYCRASVCTALDGSCPPPCEASCGDGACQNPETAENCPRDCTEDHHYCRRKCFGPAHRCEGRDETDEFRCRALCGREAERGPRTRECQLQAMELCAPECLEILFGE